MFCGNCGNQDVDGKNFCPKCGHALGAAKQETQADNTGHGLGCIFMVVAAFVTLLVLFILHTVCGLGLGVTVPVLILLVIGMSVASYCISAASQSKKSGKASACYIDNPSNGVPSSQEKGKDGPRDEVKYDWGLDSGIFYLGLWVTNRSSYSLTNIKFTVLLEGKNDKKEETFFLASLAPGETYKWNYAFILWTCPQRGETQLYCDQDKAPKRQTKTL